MGCIFNDNCMDQNSICVYYILNYVYILKFKVNSL